MSVRFSTVPETEVLDVDLVSVSASSRSLFFGADSGATPVGSSDMICCCFWSGPCVSVAAKMQVVVNKERNAKMLTQLKNQHLFLVEIKNTSNLQTVVPNLQVIIHVIVFH